MMVPKEALSFKRSRQREHIHKPPGIATKEGHWQIMTTTVHRVEHILPGRNAKQAMLPTDERVGYNPNFFNPERLGALGLEESRRMES